MENRLKLRISRMFRSSFGSCRSRNLTDIIGKPVFIPEVNQNTDVIEIEPSPPKTKPYPSICKPRCPLNTQELVHNSCITAAKEATLFTKQKVSEKNNLFYTKDHFSPLLPPRERCPRLKKTKNDKSGRVRRRMKRDCWFSSDEETEDETETLFSSKNSDSSKSFRENYRRRVQNPSRNKISNVGISPEKCISGEGVVKDSFAVVKKSNDPHGDFRNSMVEMIVERQIFAAKDLEQLLQCFLKLNSDHHHMVIVEVFMEIWEALFSNWD